MNHSDLAYYLNKMVVELNNRFMANVYKCKKLPQNAYQFLKMDLGELKEELIKMVKDEKGMTQLTQRYLIALRCSRATDPSSAKHLPRVRTS